MTSVTQSIIQPGGYALLMDFISLPLEPGDDVPNLEAEFVAPEDASGMSKILAESIPLQVEAVSFEMNTHASLVVHDVIATVTNMSDVNPKGASPYGLILFFDDNGIPTAGDTLAQSDALKPGESGEDGSSIYMDFDPAQPFLVGFSMNP